MSKYLLIASGLVLFLPCARAETGGAAPLFAETSPLSVTIEGPLSTLLSERSDTDYYEGKLTVHDADDSAQELALKFRARGNYRRRKDTCRFPPVRLNLKKNGTSGTVFEGQNILKLVTHCRPRSSKYEQYALKEYLAYKLLELHTPLSFRTRLLRITWVDTDKNNKEDERYGFVIEHKDELAERIGAEAIEVSTTTYDKLDKHSAAVVAVFQYLIGNTDFSMIAGPADDDCCHNGILVSADGETHIPIPYDFDFSGLVDAPYAGPNPRFRIQHVTTRLYRGHCSLNGEVRSVAAEFLQQQSAAMQLVGDVEGLSNNTRRRARAFLGKFYDDIGDPRRIESKLIKGCS